MLIGIHQSKRMPVDLRKPTFISIPKKAVARKCAKHLEIYLMSHTLKLLLEIINCKIERKLDVGRTQYGFVNCKGTRSA